MQPKVSVIIPVYNVEQYLRQCLDSVLGQTLKEIEIICVDDGSTDKSLDILKEYQKKDGRIIILQQKNQYAGVARNNGIKIAKGKYLSFLDSDDFFVNNMLENMYNRAEKDNSDIVVCGWRNFDDKLKKTTARHAVKTGKLLFSPEEMKDCLFTFCKPNPWSKLFRKDLFIKTGLRFEELMRCNDLTCIYSSFVLANKISIINEPYIYYRSNQKNNLSAHKLEHFDCFIYSVNRLYYFLNNIKKYDIYRKTFLNRVRESLTRELSNCKDKTKYTNLIKQLMDKDLYIALYNKKPTLSSPRRRSKYF